MHRPARTSRHTVGRIAAVAAVGAAAAVGSAVPAAAATASAAADDAGAITRFYAQYGDVNTCRSEGPRAQYLRGANSWYCTSTARLYLTWYT